MASKIVSNWFGEAFLSLAPELQRLHRDGGVLKGKVEVVAGKGVAGFIGRRISKKLNIPNAGIHDLQVTISHDKHDLHWDRQFNETAIMKSQFKPVGTMQDGYWLEKTGPLELMLTVDVEKQGWYWRCLRYRYRGLPLPVWLFPNMEAYKRIEDGGYRFYVGFSAPLIGLLFAYSGVLNISDAIVD